MLRPMIVAPMFSSPAAMKRSSASERAGSAEPRGLEDELVQLVAPLAERVVERWSGPAA